MGGYDVFEVELIGDSAYAKPKNLGYPINTTSNDIFYTVLPNKNAYYSSGRRGGYGQNDIYSIKISEINISGIANVYKDPQSPISNLVVNITNNQGTFKLSDTTDGSGRYNFSKLPSGDDYLLFIEEIDEKYILDALYTLEGQVTKMGKPFDGTQINNQKTEKNGAYKFKITNKTKVILLDEGAEVAIETKTAPSSIYKGQIAALTNEENFTADGMSEFGPIETLKLADGLTRFMVGNSKLLLEVTTLLDQVRSKGYEDAFIIVFVDGKRTYLK
jgi:hypothetical protein